MLRSAAVRPLRHTSWERALLGLCTAIEAAQPWPHAACFDWHMYRTGHAFGQDTLDGAEIDDHGEEGWPEYAASHSRRRLQALRFHYCWRGVGAHVARVWSRLERRTHRKFDFWRFCAAPRLFAALVADSVAGAPLDLGPMIAALAGPPPALAHDPRVNRSTDLWAMTLDRAAWAAAPPGAARRYEAWAGRRLAAVWCTQLTRAPHAFVWLDPLGAASAAPWAEDDDLNAYLETAYGREAPWAGADPSLVLVRAAQWAVDEVLESARRAGADTDVWLFATSFNVLELVAQAAADRRAGAPGPAEARLLRWAARWSDFREALV